MHQSFACNGAGDRRRQRRAEFGDLGSNAFNFAGEGLIASQIAAPTQSPGMRRACDVTPTTWCLPSRRSRLCQVLLGCLPAVVVAPVRVRVVGNSVFEKHQSFSVSLDRAVPSCEWASQYKPGSICPSCPTPRPGGYHGNCLLAIEQF